MRMESYKLPFFKLYFNLLICKVILIYFLFFFKCLFKFIMEKCANLAKYSLDYKQRKINNQRNLNQVNNKL